MKVKIDYSDKLILKAFLDKKEADYVREMSLSYDMDYYAGIVTQILNGTSKLTVSLSHFDEDFKEKIYKYIMKQNNCDDKIYFYLLERVYNIFCKYYNQDGTAKTTKEF